MGNNMYQGQLKGPFPAGYECFNDIRNEAAFTLGSVSHLGITAYPGTMVNINGESRKIGATGMYEIGNARITSIVFPEIVDLNTIIDYTVIPASGGTTVIKDSISSQSTRSNVYNSIIVLNTEADRNGITTPLRNCYYYVSESNILYFYDNEGKWQIVLSPTDQIIQSDMVWQDWE